MVYALIILISSNKKLLQKGSIKKAKFLRNSIRLKLITYFSTSPPNVSSKELRDG